MKRFCALLLAIGLLAMSLVGAGCTDAEVSKVEATAEDAGKATPAANTEEKKAPTTYNVGDAIKVDDLVMTVTEAAQFKSTNEYEKPEAGSVFYRVNIALENKGSEKADLIFAYKMEDAAGSQKDQSYMTSVPKPLEASSLAPGGKVSGNLVFEVPEDMKGLKLVVEPNVLLDQQIKVILTK